MKRDARALVTEIYLALERAEGRGSVDRTRAAARAVGAKFSNAESMAWLSPFLQATAVQRRKNGVIFKNESAEKRHADGLARDKVIPNSLVPLASEPTAPQRKPKQTTLGLLPPGEETAREILAALWPVVEPVIGRAMTVSSWRRKNKIAAREMAQAGLSVIEVLAAHASFCEERGETIYTLRWLHDWIVRNAAGAGTGKLNRLKRGCDCELSPEECWQLHGDDSGPGWVIVGKGKAEEA